jgi:hypothetical protein
MANHISLRFFTGNEEQHIANTKRIFVYYLWGMFYPRPPHVPIHAEIVRNWIWDHRKLIFENKDIFHWILANVLRIPYTWNYVEEDGYRQGGYTEQIRIFFHVLTDFFINSISIRDTIRLKNHDTWSYTARATLINALTHRLVHSQTIDRIRNIDEADEGLAFRIIQLNDSPVYTGYQRARDIVASRIPYFSREINHEILNFTRTPRLQGPTYEQEVINFIDRLPGWHDLMPPP